MRDFGLGHDDPTRVRAADLLDVVKRRRDVLVSNGPFFSLRARGASAIGGHFGQTVTVFLQFDFA